MFLNHFNFENHIFLIYYEVKKEQTIFDRYIFKKNYMARDFVISTLKGHTNEVFSSRLDPKYEGPMVVRVLNLLINLKGFFCFGFWLVKMFSI